MSRDEILESRAHMGDHADGGARARAPSHEELCVRLMDVPGATWAGEVRELRAVAGRTLRLRGAEYTLLRAGRADGLVVGVCRGRRGGIVAVEVGPAHAAIVVTFAAPFVLELAVAAVLALVGD